MARKKREAAPTPTPVAVLEPATTEEQIEEAEAAVPELGAETEEEMEAEVEPRLTVTQRCQEAKEISCSCRCRGKYHGKEHPAGWKDEEGCEPLTKEERRIAKREALKQWRHAHPDRVSAYMKGWFNTSQAPTAQAVRYSRAKKFNTVSRANAAAREAAEETGSV